jgi:integrase/recombinase XerD
MDRPTSTTTTAATFVLDANALISAFTSFIQFDVAAGGASAETIRTYL